MAITNKFRQKINDDYNDIIAIVMLLSGKDVIIKHQDEESAKRTLKRMKGKLKELTDIIKVIE